MDCNPGKRTGKASVTSFDISDELEEDVRAEAERVLRDDMLPCDLPSHSHPPS